jgi:hypothetical protein
MRSSERQLSTPVVCVFLHRPLFPVGGGSLQGYLPREG